MPLDFHSNRAEDSIGKGLGGSNYWAIGIGHEANSDCRFRLRLDRRNSEQFSVKQWRWNSVEERLP
jgi:hypothetical protein